MKANVKKELVVALRSGKYKQGQGALCTEDENGQCFWCCLGVLRDVCIEDEWHRQRAGENAFHPDIVVDHWTCDPEGKNYGTLSSVEMVRLGLSWLQSQMLIKWNDDDGLTFHEIADRLEQHEAFVEESET